MTQRMSTKDARERFDELTRRVHETQELLILEEQGKPFVAVIGEDDLNLLSRARTWELRNEFSRRAKLTGEPGGSEEDEQRVVREVREDREKWFRERHV